MQSHQGTSRQALRIAIPVPRIYKVVVMDHRYPPSRRRICWHHALPEAILGGYVIHPLAPETPVPAFP
jgi:hypothetical protein